MFARKNHNRLNGSLTVGTATVKKTNQCKYLGVRQSPLFSNTGEKSNEKYGCWFHNF